MVREIPEGLIVSCQALKDEPLYGGNTIPKIAKAAKIGGAVAIRTNSVRNVNRIDKIINGDLPIIGLIKQDYNDSSIYITPTLKEVKKLIKSKCDVIALDATLRHRPNGEKLDGIVAYIREHTDIKIMADIATIEEAKNAERLGVDYISSTLRGYTEDTCDIIIPDLSFLEQLLNEIKLAKVVAEGGIYTKEELRGIIDLGYKHIVIGSAITRPHLITEKYVSVFEYNNINDLVRHNVITRGENYDKI